jgi:hypothetical protein
VHVLVVGYAEEEVEAPVRVGLVFEDRGDDMNVACGGEGGVDGVGVFEARVEDEAF